MECGRAPRADVGKVESSAGLYQTKGEIARLQYAGRAEAKRLYGGRFRKCFPLILLIDINALWPVQRHSQDDC